MNKTIDITTDTFTIKPTIRFSETMNVKKDLWSDMWNRYKNLKYSKWDLVEWFYIRTKKRINERTIRRWIIRQELYDDAQIAVKAGAKTVSIDYFVLHGNRNIEEIDLVDRDDYLL